MGGKHCGKRRHCLLQVISPFPTSFMKIFALQAHKNQGLFGKGLTLYQMTLFWTRPISQNLQMKKKINVAKMNISVFDKKENIVRKGENAGYQHFLLFSPCFKKPSFARSLKVGIMTATRSTDDEFASSKQDMVRKRKLILKWLTAFWRKECFQMVSFSKSRKH